MIVLALLLLAGVADHAASASDRAASASDRAASASDRAASASDRAASAPDRALVELRLAENELKGLAPDDVVAPDAADRALEHVTRALAIDPTMRAAYQLELQVLVGAERFDEVLPTLKRGLDASAGDDPVAWLDTASGLFVRGRADDALAASRLVEKRWPRDPAVLASTGAALAVLERDDEALVYLRAASEASPKDPVAQWNLARLLAYMGRDDEASQAFARWSALETDSQRLVRNSCIYAEFVEKQLGDLHRACMLQTQFCPDGQRTACDPQPAPPAPEKSP